LEVFTFDLHSCSRFNRTGRASRGCLAAFGSPRGRPLDFPARGHRFSPPVAIGPPRRPSPRRPPRRGRVRAVRSSRRSDPPRSSGGACAALAGARRRLAVRPRPLGPRRHRRRAGCGRSPSSRRRARSGRGP